MPEKKFSKECRVFKHPMIYKDVIDIFIFTNSKHKFGEGQYSMYICCINGVLLYEGIDKKDSSNIQVQPLKGSEDNDLLNCFLSAGTMDCNPKGQILFDIKTIGNTHKLKSFIKDKSQSKYDYKLEGEKKMIRFFNNYVIEVKTERKMDKI